MNERIRELWRECVVRNTKEPMNWQTVADEFAELIILESNYWIHRRIGPKTALDFLEHFGVEE
jgi:hypothetical protein